MSYRSAPFWWLVCDLCGATSTEGSEHVAWMDQSQAVDDAECGDWWVEDGNHLCAQCVPEDQEDQP
jgi:hypothetical protein